MNTRVNFEIAKLLKEKGFDEPCNDYYTSRGLLNSDGLGDIIYEGGFGSGEPERMLKFDYSDFNKRQKADYTLCPTIADVVMWLYEKHGIWIYVSKNGVHWNPTIDDNTIYLCCDEPTKAYSSAIEFTLKNLIK